MSPLQVGRSRIDVTPPPGLPLMGNFRDDYAARGVRDALWARALVLADAQGEKAGLLSVDVCMLDRENVALLRSVIGSECEIPPENVLIHATHTHSGPAASGKLGLADEIAPHAGAIEAFLRKTAGAVVEAAARLEEARLEVGCASGQGISFNRRLRRRDGTTQMNWEALQPDFDPSQIVGAWGPVDPQVVCLTARGEGGPIAALVHFGLHPAILAGDNWHYSADYPGCLVEALSRSLGADAHCQFLNGCCGDVNHIDYRQPQGRGYGMVRQVGSALAARARQAIASAMPLSAGCVRVSRERVRLERLRIDPRQRRWCEEVLQLAQRRPPQGQVDGLPEAYFARLRLEMGRDQDRPDEVEVMVVRIGGAAIVGLPGEAFCALGLKIKRRSPARQTLVAGLCNDAIGYLPTREAFEHGGYETLAGSTFYEPGSAERLVESAVSQLERLFAATAGDQPDSAPREICLAEEEAFRWPNR